MAIIHVSRGILPAIGKRRCANSSRDPAAIPVSNVSDAISAVSVRSPIEKQPSDMSTHIFSFLDPESLARVGRTCRTLSTITKQDQLWKRHCTNQFIPITDSKTARECFLEAKNLAHRLMSTPPRQLTWSNYIHSVFVEKDRVFIGLSEGVEVLDHDLNHVKKFNINASYTDNTRKIKIIGNILYYLNTYEQNRQNGMLSFFRFDLITGRAIDRIDILQRLKSLDSGFKQQQLIDLVLHCLAQELMPQL